MNIFYECLSAKIWNFILKLDCEIKILYIVHCFIVYAIDKTINNDL